MDVQEDAKALQKYGPIDAYQDWSPPQASTSTHIRSCIQVLKVGGRASLMGGIAGDISLSYSLIMFRNLQIHGRFMYRKEDIPSLVKMINTGVLKLNKEMVVEKFPLERWFDAFSTAEKSTALGRLVLLSL